MKRSRFLALALVVAVALMGAGYAYWTDTLTINNTVSTGELNVQFTAASLESVDDGPDSDDDYVYEDGTDVDLSDDNKEITLKAANLYPGASVDFSTTIKNTGSIPAILKPVGFVHSADSVLEADGKSVATPEEREDFILNGEVVYNGVPITLPTFNLRNIETINRFLPQRMEPNDTAVINLTLTLNDGLENDQLENKYINTVMTLNFKQHNDPAAQ